MFYNWNRPGDGRIDRHRAENIYEQITGNTRKAGLFLIAAPYPSAHSYTLNLFKTNTMWQFISRCFSQCSTVVPYNPLILFLELNDELLLVTFIRLTDFESAAQIGCGRWYRIACFLHQRFVSAKMWQCMNKFIEFHDRLLRIFGCEEHYKTEYIWEYSMQQTCYVCNKILLILNSCNIFFSLIIL